MAGTYLRQGFSKDKRPKGYLFYFYLVISLMSGYQPLPEMHKVVPLFSVFPAFSQGLDQERISQNSTSGL